MAYNVARDGRKAYVYFVKEDKTTKVTTKLAVGKWYHVVKKADTGSAFTGVEEGHAFYCGKDNVTPAAEDECYELKLGFLGFAQGKDLNESKTVTDITCDKDDTQNNTIDPIVALTGSVQGLDLMEEYQDGQSNPVTELRQRFSAVVTYAADGTPTFHAQKSTKRDTIIIGWDMREIADGEPAAFDIIPCVLSSKARSGAYGSAQSMSFDFTGCDSSDEGLKRSHQQIVYKGLVLA